MITPGSVAPAGDERANGRESAPTPRPRWWRFLLFFSARSRPRPTWQYLLFCLGFLATAFVGAAVGGTADTDHIGWLSQAMEPVVGLSLAGVIVSFGRGVFRGRLRRAFWRYPPSWTYSENHPSVGKRALASGSGASVEAIGRFPLWAPLAVPLVLAVLEGISLVVVILSPGQGLYNSFLAVVINIAVIAGCVRLAVEIEHRLRAHYAHYADGATVRKAPVRATRVYHHRHGPAAAAIGAVFFSALVAGFVYGDIQAIDGWRLSQYVQAHGDKTPAVVASVHQHEDQGRSGTTYWADITVDLQPPVHGHNTTTVHYPGQTPLAAGERVTVLVDPHQAGYAELPGSPDTTGTDWALLQAFAVVALLIAGYLWHEVGAWIRQRRSSRPSGRYA